jgi:hypothetical protein
MSTSQMQNAHPGKLGKLSERDGAQASATTIEDMWNCRSGHRHPLASSVDADNQPKASTK